MSGMNEHPELQLSAYLDEALSPSERAAVAAHLDGCASCQRRLAELRAISRLLAALPSLAPTRSLVPRVERAPVWLRPVRLLGAIGSGLFVFLFIASAVINSGSSLGGGETTAEQLAAKGQFGAAVNALASDAAARKDAASAAPAPAAPAAAGQAPQGSFRTVSGSSPSAGPSTVGRADAASTSAPSTFRDDVGHANAYPQIFLALAVVCGFAAILAHRRLRRS